MLLPISQTLGKTFKGPAYSNYTKVNHKKEVNVGMAKVSFIFIAGTLLTILAAGSVLMSFFSAASRSVSNETSEIAGNFSSSFLKATIFLVILIAVVSILTGKNLAL